MRTSEAAFAWIVQRRPDGTLAYLLQWNPRWTAFSFVGGQREPDECFHSCCIREVHEELGLTDGVDCRIASTPLTHLEYTAYSESARLETAYTFELFTLEFLRDQARRTVSRATQNHWATPGEIESGLSVAGQRISKTVREVMTRGGLLPAGRDR